MIHFDWPWVFLILPLPWLVRYLLPAVQGKNEAVLRLPTSAQSMALPAAVDASGRRRPVTTWIVATLAWLLLVGAASRPQWLGEPVNLPVNGRDLLLAVDLSGSMEVRDFQLEDQMVDRLTAIKQVAGEFIRRRKGDRVGLILFGRNAYLQAPLTFDRKTVQTFLEESIIGLAGKETAIGDAIGLAVKKILERPLAEEIKQPAPTGADEQGKRSSRVLILLTDGANTAGQISPIKAAQLAASEGLKIYTIGIGADEMLVRTIFGTRRVNPSEDLDEKTLTEIAKLTGGRYFRARDRVALEEIYRLLDQLEPVQDDSQTFRPTHGLFYWPLGAGLLLGYGLAWRYRLERLRP
ncbi:MAG: VWA domain-containing protein [Magnetococcales bacterium]|nr:VWA domain-containing protein [Magnetococcales bacterium]